MCIESHLKLVRIIIFGVLIAIILISLNSLKSMEVLAITPPQHPYLLFSESEKSNLINKSKDYTQNQYFETSTGEIWGRILSNVNDYVDEVSITDKYVRPSFINQFYYFYYPYLLEPVSHGEKGLRVGIVDTPELITQHAYAIRKIDELAVDDYYIEFDYKYPSEEIMTDYKVWSSYDDTEYDDIIIKQTANSLYCTNGDPSTWIYICDIDGDKWHKIIIHVKTGGKLDVTINNQLILQDINQIGSGNLKAIGYLGDNLTGDGFHNGSATFDNIKIYYGSANVYSTDFNNGNINDWTISPKSDGTVSLVEDGRGRNSLHIGSSTYPTNASYAKKDIPELDVDNYYINFEYMVPYGETMDRFVTWGSYDGSEYDDVRIKHTGTTLYCSDGDLSTWNTICSIEPERWYNILMHVKSDNTYEIFVDGESKQTGTQIGTGNLKAIGYLGGVSESYYAGSAYYDNIRIYSSYVPIYVENFDDLNCLNSWQTKHGFVELPEIAVLSHSDYAYDTGYPYWSAIASSLSTRLQNLSVAYIIENNNSYASKAKQIMMSLANWSVWNDPDYISQPTLDIARITMSMAYAYDMLYDDLTPEEKLIVSQAIKHKGLDIIYNSAITPGSMAYYDGKSGVLNATMVLHAAMGIGALAIAGDIDCEDIYIDLARETIYSMYDNGCDIDGGWPESFNYSNFALSRSLLFHDADKRITGEDAFEKSKYLPLVCDFALYNQNPDGSGFSMIGDTHANAHYFSSLFSYWAKFLGNNTAAWMLQKSGSLKTTADLLNFLWFPDSITPEEPEKPLGKRFEEMGWVCFKTGWMDNDSMMVMRSGKRYSHMHLDQNTFVIQKGSSSLISDIGYKHTLGNPARNFSFGSEGHNIILADSSNQLSRMGNIDSFFINDKYGYAVGDATLAYEKLSKWKRTLVNMIGGKYFVLYDRYQNKNIDCSLSWNLHSAADSIYMNSNSEIIMNSGNDFLNIKIFEPEEPTVTLSDALYSVEYKVNKPIYVNVPSADTYKIKLEYATYSSTELLQYKNFDDVTVLIGTLEADPAFPDVSSFKTSIFVLDSSMYDYYEDESNINVKLYFNDAVFIKSMQLLDEYDNVIDTVTPADGDLGDDIIAQHNTGICFGEGRWKSSFMLSDTKVRGNHSFYRISMPIISTNEESGILALMYPSSDSNLPITNYLYDADDVGFVLERQGTRDVILFHKNSLEPDILPDAYYCDVGTADDNNISAHNPGINICDSVEWSVSSIMDGKTVRNGNAGAELFANINDSTSRYKITLIYKASNTCDIYQYLNPQLPDGGYKPIGKIIGDNTWRIDTYVLDRSYFDFDSQENNINVLLQFGNNITLSDIWIADVGDEDYNDIGTQGDNSNNLHTPGVSIGDGWGQESIVDGLTVRQGSNPCDLYANIEIADKPHTLVLKYKAASSGHIMQRGTSQLETIGNIIGDGNWHVQEYRLYEPYFDSDNIVDGTNVLIRLDCEAFIADAWLKSDQAEVELDYADIGTHNDNEDEGNHTPGISLLPSEWYEPEIIDGYTVRRGPARANALVRFPNIRNGYRVYFRYKSDEDCTVSQYNGSDYVIIGTLDGGDRWRVSSLPLSLDYYDYSNYESNAGILLQFDNSITLADAWVELEMEDIQVDWNDIGKDGDNNVNLHTDGISVLPVEWDDPSIVDGRTVRIAQERYANLYINVVDISRDYCVTVHYKCSQDGYLEQYNGSNYEIIGNLIGDNTWRTVKCELIKPYFDYNGNGSNWATNILTRFSIPVTISDVVLEYR